MQIQTSLLNYHLLTFYQFWSGSFAKTADSSSSFNYTFSFRISGEFCIMSIIYEAVGLLGFSLSFQN